MTQWSFSFDSASLQAISRLGGFEKFLEPELAAGMREAVDLVAYDAITFMWATFMNPQGALEGNVQTDVPDPYTGIVYNDSPYAWRREAGFSGMTDALGRYYPSDPGISYFERTLAQDTPQIARILEMHTSNALSAMGGP